MIVWRLFLLVFSGIGVGVNASFVTTRIDKRHFCRHNSFLFGEPNDTANNEYKVPSFIQSPVLQKAYPAMMEHKENYGNPNIPLGNPDGTYVHPHPNMPFVSRLSSYHHNRR